MDNTFTFEKFKKEKIAVHCETQTEYDAFMQLCEKANLTWNGGYSATAENCWNIYEADTAITAEYGFLMYSPDSFYTWEGYNFYEAADIIKQFT